MAQATPVRASKRKRTTISYAELDERTFDELNGGGVDDSTNEIELSVNDDDEDDITYGSKKVHLHSVPSTSLPLTYLTEAKENQDKEGSVDPPIYQAKREEDETIPIPGPSSGAS